MAMLDELPSPHARVSSAALRACVVGARVASAAVLALACWSLVASSEHASLDRLAMPGVRPFGAMLLLLLAVALGCASRPEPTRLLRVVGRASAGVAAAFGLFVVARALFGSIPGIFPWFSTSVVLLALALLIADHRTAGGRQPSEYLALAVLAIAFVVFFGHVFGAQLSMRIAGSERPTGMTFGATVGLFVLAFGTICAMPESRLVTMVSSTFLGGVVARRLTVAVLLLPCVSLLVTLGQRASLVGAELAATILAAGGMFAGIVLLYATAKTVDRVDLQRSAAMRELLRWKAFFDNAASGALLSDPEGRILLANPALARMHGYPSHELESMRVADLIAPECRESCEAQEALLRTRGHARFRADYIDRFGRTFPVIVDATCVKKADGSVDYCIHYVQDVTDWRTAERYQSMLATVVESSNDAIATLSLPSLDVQTWNAAAERLFGWTIDEIRTGRYGAMPWVPRDRGAEITRMHEDLEHGRRIDTLPTERQRKDGSRFFALVNAWPVTDSVGRVTMYSTTTRDVSHERESAEALRRSEERYRALFEQASDERLRLQAILDQMPDGVIVVDADGQLVAKNRAAEALSASPREIAPSGREVFIDLRSPTGDPLESDDLPLNRLLRLGAATRSKELVAVLRDGRSIPLLVSAAEVRAPRGALIGAVETFQDISTLKDIERMREEWASVVAHDLRQPLHAIELNAQLLEKFVHGLEGADVVRRSVERIEGAVGRLDRMIRDLSDVSRIEARRLALQTSSVDLVELAEDVVERFGSLSSVVTTHAQGERRPIVADPDRVDQVLTNLLSNAFKYGESGGPVTLAIDFRDACVAVSVTNRGKGIAPDEVERVFNRFERSRETSRIGGLGLGLYICRGLVEAHGGHIGVESILGKTTTFTFTLPYEVLEARASAPTLLASHASPSS